MWNVKPATSALQRFVSTGEVRLAFCKAQIYDTLWMYGDISSEAKGCEKMAKESSKRVTLVVGVDALERLYVLAGGKRKVGAWLTHNVGQLAAWEADSRLVARMRADVETLLKSPYDI